MKNLNLIHKKWDVTEIVWSCQVLGCPMVVLQQKLKMLKCKLKTWIKNVYGNAHQLVV